jgi:hypothetical protein
VGRQAIAVVFLAGILAGGRTSVAQTNGDALIEGVPPIGWVAARYSYHISALQAALQAMGCSATYEELMVISGAGFRAAWCVGQPSYSVTCVHPDNDDYVLVGAAGVGATAELAQQFGLRRRVAVMAAERVVEAARNQQALLRLGPAAEGNAQQRVQLG